MLKTNRGLAKFYFLSLITFGIYGLVVLCNVSIDINTIASRRDGKHTMNYLLLYFIFSWLTLGIAPLVWFHRISNRIGGQLAARNLPYSFNASDFWLWCMLGSLIIVGPFIYLYKFFKAMNIIADDYNKNL
jgi:hypothetical protein